MTQQTARVNAGAPTFALPSSTTPIAFSVDSDMLVGSGILLAYGCC
jgi:hypothetical protein